MSQGGAATNAASLNRRSEPLTRFGIHEIVTRYAQAAMSRVPDMRKKRISPHTIRHTTATQVLGARVDINTIRAWLGHVCINTTNIYAETDLQMKAKALGLCAVESTRSTKHWRDNPNLYVLPRPYLARTYVMFSSLKLSRSCPIPRLNAT